MAAAAHAGTFDGSVVTFTRTFNAPRDRVFEAWTDPRHVARWWGPHGSINHVRALDVRPGGAWRIEQHAPDGAVHHFKGIYLEVVAPERIVNTFHMEGVHQNKLMIETHCFEALDGRTRLTTVSRLEVIPAGEAGPMTGPSRTATRGHDRPMAPVMTP
ncbi:SRPBCC domain-containing protein [Phreatobacter stygius]|uniref:Activator of Hsp90 ATPase homologue 1/2-like C-terminal domain-containing protein n=1 Tax=Phreatobacter stygius TaxID=1940610 RepID=A0A4D7B9Z7_9HYPH|nr:SRPBCC domain-containing protein [Phreatobacter stygius]QCI67420.1 hypothetical protein E8M01_26255 [Phreatobacter stygius]